MNRFDDDAPLTKEYEIRFLNQLTLLDHRCAGCEGQIEGMADFVSNRARREFALSGLCQRCQRP